MISHWLQISFLKFLKLLIEVLETPEKRILLFFIMMQTIGAWNIRGAHLDIKLDQMKMLIREHNLPLLSISETKLNAMLSCRAARYINPSWKFIDNLSHAPYDRFLVVYNPSIYLLSPIISTNQLIHSSILHIPSSTSFYITFIYASNSVPQRTLLFIPHFRQDSHPWLVLGDFNSFYLAAHKSGGPPLSFRQISPLNLAIQDSSLLEIPSSGSEFTWTNKSRHGVKTLTRIDHAFSNFQAISLWPKIHLHIRMPLLPDHCPLILTFGESDNNIKSSFKFFNTWTNEHDFSLIVLQAWNTPVFGNPTYRLQQKLKNTKRALRSWALIKFGKGNRLSTPIMQQHKIVQDKILNQSADPALSLLEIELTNKLSQALIVEASMVRQKSRENWDTKGDRNTKFYHASLNVKQCRANIQVIKNEHGIEVNTHEAIDLAFLEYYTSLLASQTTDQTNAPFLANFTLPQISDEHINLLQASLIDDDIKKTVFNIRREACGGPDGFNATFFTHCWEIIKADFLKAVHNFFNKGRMLASTNATNIALIPKILNPTNVTQFRPISCCNFTYKVIAKILATKLKPVLSTMISSNQAAFLPKRSILDNVLIVHELLNGYRTSNPSPRAMIKIDIRKAFDTVNWNALFLIMRAMGFPEHFVSLIRTCISSVT